MHWLDGLIGWSVERRALVLLLAGMLTPQRYVPIPV